MRVLLAALFLLIPSFAIADAFIRSGDTVSLTVTTTTGSVQFQPTPTGPNVRFYNTGAVAAFVVCGDSGITATTVTGIPLAPGTVEVLACPGTYIAAITASGTTTVYITPGTGI